MPKHQSRILQMIALSFLSLSSCAKSDQNANKVMTATQEDVSLTAMSLDGSTRQEPHVIDEFPDWQFYAIDRDSQIAIEHNSIDEAEFNPNLKIFFPIRIGRKPYQRAPQTIGSVNAGSPPRMVTPGLVFESGNKYIELPRRFSYIDNERATEVQADIWDDLVQDRSLKLSVKFIHPTLVGFPKADAFTADDDEYLTDELPIEKDLKRLVEVTWEDYEKAIFTLETSKPGESTSQWIWQETENQIRTRWNASIDSLIDEAERADDLGLLLTYRLLSEERLLREERELFMNVGKLNQNQKYDLSAIWFFMFHVNDIKTAQALCNLHLTTHPDSAIAWALLEKANNLFGVASPKRPTSLSSEEIDTAKKLIDYHADGDFDDIPRLLPWSVVPPIIPELESLRRVVKGPVD